VAAERWWAGRDATAGTLMIGSQSYAVVGVADNVAWQTLGERATPYVFLPLAQSGAPAGSLTLAVRSTSEPLTMTAGLRSQFHALEPDLGMMALAPLADWVDDAIAPQRVAATLLTAFGLLAVVIAALGIYGVVSYHVARQTRAIGVRIALGAPRAHVARLVAKGVAAPVVAGLLAGLGAAWALAGFVRPFLFSVEPHDPLTLGSVAIVLMAIAACATLGPTLRAARIAPMEALRHD
jgi:ABC-type antimicrobial peptide transport system permease subunit